MIENITDYKIQIEKISQRIKEYLWEAWYSVKTWQNKSKNFRRKFLAK